MSRSSNRFYFRLIVVLFMAAAVLAAAAYYIVCLLAVQVSVGLGRRCATNDIRRHAEADGALVGLASMISWTVLIAALISAVLDSNQALAYALAVAAPAGAVIGWQVGIWQTATSWSRSPGGQMLGEWTSRPCFVRRPYTVTLGERTRHLTCSGATGSGKSTLLRNLILQDLRMGQGLCVIDPKDDLIDGILPHLPKSRLEDVILFDITDVEAPLGLNPFAGVALEQRSLAASELLSVFRRYFADAWGARLEHVLRNVILALLEVEGATLADVPRLLRDRSYLDSALRQVTNPAVREFFLYEYEEVLHRRGDAVEPILNKVGPWLDYPELRAIVDQPENSFDFRQVLDRGLILLVRIPQGAHGEDVSNLLGAMVVAKLQLAAQSRVNLPQAQRRPFFLYVDEFQNFATSAFTKILTEARGFNLGLVCANQYPEQLSRELQQALQHNAATFVQAVQRKGKHELEVIRQEDLQEKKPPVYQLTPTGPLAAGDAAWAQEIRETSRRRYGRPLQGSLRSEAAAHEMSRPLVLSATRDVEEE
jgi:hypothetical protein